MTAPLRKTGIGFVDEIPWGSHLCHFFETKEDLLDALLPFLKAGLEAREFCLWVVAEPLTLEESRNALRRIVPDLDRFLADGSIEIHSALDWYLSAGAIDLRRLVGAWDKKLAQAVHDGFAGMRVTGSTAWLQEEAWRAFSEYEEKLNEWIADKRLIALCSYPLVAGSAAILDVARTHRFAMAKRNGTWEVVETPEFREAKAESTRLNQELQHETLLTIFDNMPVMISVYDTAGRLLRVNREWTRVLGWTLEEAQRVDIMAETYPDPEQRKQVLDFIRRAEHDWVDFKPRTRDGRVIDASWARFRLSDGSVIGFGLDITERKQAEEERARLLQSESRARAEAETALERLRAVQSITDAALSRLGLDDLLRELLARLRSTLRAEVASVRLIDEERKELYPRAIDGVPLERVAGVGIPLDAVHLDAPFLSNDIEPPGPGRDDWYAKAWSALNMPLRAGMSTPLLVEGKPIGLVGVTSTRTPFTEDDLRLLQVVADRVAPAIERGRLGETVRVGREQLKALSRRLLTAQEEERRRLAVELHDELGQVLTAVKINLASLERESGAATTPAHLRDAIASVDLAMERVRDLALDLRPSVLDDLGLPAAVRWYVDRFARTAHVEAHLSIDAVSHLPPELETACFRVAQEALTNVARHARSRNVWVDLHLVAEALDLRVRDDGIGFDAGAARERAIKGASLGLLGMQERVSLVGGEYQLSSQPRGGTEVRARFPLGEKARGAP